MHLEPTEPRPFNPKSPPREWIHDDEKPPKWPETFVMCGKDVQFDAGVIYRFYDAGMRLLYIGMSDGDPTYRWQGHRYQSDWWSLAAFMSIAYASPVRSIRAAREREAIRAERPLYNKEHNKPRVHLDVRLDRGMDNIVEQFREILFADDFAGLVKAFKAEPDGAA
jgi:hypothetical protein